MTEQFFVEEQSSLHSYRTELPNILFELQLDPSAFQLYCYYKRVAGDKGACFQKKATIATKLNMSESTIKKKNKQLAESFSLLGGKSLIKIIQRKDETGNNAPTVIQIIDIWPDNFKEIATGAKNDPPSDRICPTLGQNLSAEEDPFKKIPFKKYKESTKESCEAREMGDTPKPPTPTKIPKIQRRENVHTTEKEHADLCNKLGEGFVEKCYDRLQEWKEEVPRSRWKKTDARSIKNWVIDAVKERERKENKLQSEEKKEDNITFAKRIAQNYNEVRGRQLNVRLEATQDCLIIYSLLPTTTRPPTKIHYKECGFQEQVKVALEKWGL